VISNVKDLLEQIRTFHLALVAVCVTLLALVSTHTRSTVQSAIHEADELILASNTWEWNWFTEEAERRLAERREEYRRIRGGDEEILPKKILVFTAWGATHRAEVHIRPNQWQVYHSKTKMSWDWVNHSSYAPASVREWKQFWNAIEGESEIHSDMGPTTVFWTDKSATPIVGQWSDVGPADERIELALEDRRVLRIFGYDDSVADHMGSQDVYTGVFVEKATGRIADTGFGDNVVFQTTSPLITTVNFQQAFIKKHQRWPLGTFEDAFQELDQSAKGLDDLKLSQTRSVLQTMEKNSPEAVETLGIKLPAVSAAVWGPVIVICVQLYLLLYLSSFTFSLLTETPEVAWIGLFRSWLPRIATMVSIVFLPVITVLFCDRRGWSTFEVGFWLRTWFVVFGVLSLLVAVATAFYIPSFHSAAKSTSDATNNATKRKEATDIRSGESTGAVPK
jgi:hypothetical protein